MKKLLESFQKRLREAESATKTFSFSKDELRTLERSVREIAAAAAKATSSPIPAFSIKPLVQQVQQTKSEPTQLQAVAEAETNDIDNWKRRLQTKTGTAKSQFSPEEAEDALKLRQQYYGSEGEIEKARLAKKIKPEKGIGELSPEEFEQAGYVIKVPEHVLDDFNVMVQELKAVGDVYEQARSWYHNIKKMLLDVSKSDRDAALYGLLIATFSPRAKFSINLAEATFMFKAVAADARENPEGLKEYTKTFTGDKGESDTSSGKTRHIGHLKVANFSLNLIKPDLAGTPNPDTGELQYNEEYRWNSTIDTWMIDAFYPLLKRASTAGEYNALKGKMMSDPMTYTYLSELVAKKAKQLNLLPHELQAIIWVAMKKRQSGEDAATTDDSFKQIEAAIQNIHSIRKDMTAIAAELKKSSWADVISKDIDERGIQAAADVVLGQQSVDPQTGKPSKIQGVRSIAMSGKKGDSYKYFPDDEKAPGPKADRRIKPKKGQAPKEKVPAPYEDERFSELKTYWVLNNVVMMPTGKLTNLSNAINMYLSDGFSTDSAVKTIISDFDRAATSASKFLEQLSQQRYVVAESLFENLVKKLF